MSFLHPEFLYYMLLPLVIFFFFVVTQQDKQEAFFAEDVLQRLRVNSKSLTLRARNVIYFFISVLLVLALAQPVIPDGKVKVQAKSADIMIALDISNSMRAQDIYPSRLKMAQHKILELLKMLPEDRVGVIAFAKASYLVSPLSFDHDAVRFLVKRLQPGNISKQGTDFGQLLYSTNRSIKDKNYRYLVIFTDGGDQQSFQDEISYAKAHKITVFVIALGTKKGAPIKTSTGFMTYKGKIVITKLNQNIASLATQTGGVYIKGILSDADVRKMVEEIDVKTRQKVLKSHIVRHDIPLFYYPLALALLLLLIATSSFGSFKKNCQTGLLTVLLLLFTQVPSRAGIMDFHTLDQANSAYKNHQYVKSSRLFAQYQKNRDTNDVRYDRANALYKAKQYTEAAKIYKELHFQNRIKKANAFYNLGNAYAKQGDERSLKKALKSYETSLSLHEDAQTRYNIKVVKTLLKQKQQKQQKKQEQNQKKNNSNKQNSSQNNQQQNQNKNNQQKQNQQNKQNKQNSQNKQNKQNSQNKENKQGGQSRKNEQSKQNDRQQNTQNNRNIKQSGTKEHNKDLNQSKNAAQSKQKPEDMRRRQQEGQQFSHSPSGSQKMQKTPVSEQQNISQQKNTISKAEMKQWLKQIDFNAPTHMYKMRQMRTDMKDGNEKPW